MNKEIEYGTVVFHLSISKLQKKTKPHASFTLNRVVAFISQIYLKCISSYEKISIAILAGVLRDDIECTGIGVIHAPSRLKWDMSFDTGYQPLLDDV